MAVKSAIMTTAYQKTKTGKPGKAFGTPFDYGAGHVDPTAALNPGLVIDAGIRDWMQFLCGQGEVERSQWSETCPTCLETPEACIPANLNYPSIALPSLVGVRSVFRVLKSVLAEPADFTTSIEVPPGFEVETSPEAFTLAPGESIRVNITIRWASAVFDEYQAGAVSWLSSKDTKTRIPIAAKAQQFGAPLAVAIDAKAAPSGSFEVTPGFSGGFAALAIGMQASTITEGSIKSDGFSIFDASETARANVFTIPVDIPVGTVLAKFAMFDADQAAPGNDIDLYLYNASGRVGVSGEPTVAEEISVSQPVPGPYTVYVHGYQLPNGAADFKVHAWILTVPAAGAAEGSLKASPGAASPADVQLGVPTTVSYELNATAIQEGGRYAGAIVYAQGTKDTGVVPVGSMTLVTLA